MEIPEKSALIVIDVQKGLLGEDATQPTPCVDVMTAAENILKILEVFRKKKLPVIHFKELHRKELVDFGRELDGRETIHCVEGTSDAEFMERFGPIEGEYFIGKRRYSGFFATDLDLLLRGLGVDTVFIAGFLTDVCVHYTSVDAHQYNYHVKVFSDAVRGSSWEAHQASLNAIEYLQTGAIIKTTDLFR